MALRELAKCDTSTSSQALLTNQAREDNLASKKRKEEEENQVQELVKEKDDVVMDEFVACPSPIPEGDRNTSVNEAQGNSLEEKAETDNETNKLLEIVP